MASHQNPTLRLEEKQVVVIFTLVSDLVTAALLQSSAMLVAKIKQKLSWSAVTDHAIRETDDLVSDPRSDPTLNAHSSNITLFQTLGFFDFGP